MTKPKAPAVRVDAVPQELRELNRWVLWKYVQKKRKDDTLVWTKMPMQRNGRVASSTNAKTWCTFDEIIDAYLMGETACDGIGITLDGSDKLVGIDLDDCIDVLGNYTALATEVLDRIPGYAEISPSGTGVKLWTRAICDGHRTAEGAPDALEIYPNGRYFTVTGNRLEGLFDGEGKIPTEPVDVAWLVAKVFGPGAVRERTAPTAGQDASGDDSDADALALYRRPLDGWPLERVVEELLPVLDPGCSYDEWMQVGAAMHHQGEGGEEWLEAWETWSAGSEEKWSEGYTTEKWDSFSLQRSTGRGPVTLATLIKRVAEEKDKLHGAVAVEWGEQVAAVADWVALERLCKRIGADVRLDEVLRAMITNVVRQRFKDLGNPLPVATIRNLLAPVKKAETPQHGSSRVPAWARPWIYVTTDDCFFNVETKELLSPQSFNFRFNRELDLPPDEKVSATVFAAEFIRLDTVNRQMYLPWAELLFEHEGLNCVNTYRADLLPAVPPIWDEESVAAVYLIEQHIFKLFGGNRREAFTLLDWMAFNVQNPGRKVRWAPLIKGCEGDGKSTIATILTAAMGGRNVKPISAKSLADGFTGWAEGSCVGILEELRAHSASRFDVLEVVKPFITNDVVPVRRMRTDEYKAPNTQNYLGFTNHDDALPVDDRDRRWWIAFTPYNTKEDVAQAYPPGYFGALVAAIEQHPGAVRRWLLEWPVSDGFRQHGPAPESTAKTLMSRSNWSDVDWAVEAAVQAGGVGYSAAVVSTGHLRGALHVAGVPIADQKFGLARALRRLGFAQAPATVRWNEGVQRIWVRDGKLLLHWPNGLSKVKELLRETESMEDGDPV